MVHSVIFIAYKISVSAIRSESNRIHSFISLYEKRLVFSLVNNLFSVLWHIRIGGAKGYDWESRKLFSTLRAKTGVRMLKSQGFDRIKHWKLTIEIWLQYSEQQINIYVEGPFQRYFVFAWTCSFHCFKCMWWKLCRQKVLINLQLCRLYSMFKAFWL